MGKPAVLPEKPAEEEAEEDLGDQERKERDKVRDEFGERRSIKPAEEEKIIIKPAVLPEKSKDEGEKSPAGKKKVSDHFPEKKKPAKKDGKTVIKPKDLPKKKGARVRFGDQPGVVRRKK